MKNYAKLYFIVLSALIVAPMAYGANLDTLLSIAYDQNHGIKAFQEDSRAEDNSTTSQYNLEDPTIGFSELDRGTTTQYFTIRQKIKFPYKYYLEGKAQNQRYKSALNTYKFEKLKLREKIINIYFNLYATQKTMDLTRANLQIVKDSARVAEKKYAAGESSQANSMKAHLEMTELEIDLLNLEKNEESYQYKIKALLNKPEFADLKLNGLNISQPIVSRASISRIEAKLKSHMESNSPALKIQKKNFDAAVYDRKIAKWNFAPDFEVQYQQRISGFPQDSKILSVNATIPLWFWSNSAEASQASAKALSAEHRFKSTFRRLSARFLSLKVHIEKTGRTLKIYKTTLIPQAEGALRSTQSAYKTGKISFLNLLDSERSLYRVKQNYFKSLTRYVSDITALESLLGYSISDLHGIEEAMK